MSLLKNASVVSLFTLASRVTGLLREVLMASAFGASALTDAFNVAFRIPNMFRRLFAEGAFSQAFVPVLARARASGPDGEAVARDLVAQVARALTGVLVVTCVVGVAGAPLLVWAMAGGLAARPAAFEAAINMTRIMFPYIAFMSLVAMASGVLNTYKRFAVPAFTPVLLNVSMIAAAWWGAPWLEPRGVPAIYAMAAGVMLGGVLQLALIAWALKHQAFLPRLSAHPRTIWQALRSDATRAIWTRMLPALLGVSVAQISLLINTQIASRVGERAVSWLSYADRLLEFPVAMLGVALGVVLTPQLSAAQAKGEAREYSLMLDWGLRLVVMLGLPCAVALLVFAQPMVASVYQRGAFTAQDVQQTSLALMGYGVGLVGMLAIKVLAPGFFAKDDTKTPALIAVAVLTMTQLLNWVLVPVLGHSALALSIGAGAVVNAVWLLVGLLMRGSYKPQPGWGTFVLQVIAACALLAVGLLVAGWQINWVALQTNDLARVFTLALVLSGAAALYLGALWAGGLNLRQVLRH